MTAVIRFKAKPETIYNMDDTIAFQRIKVPALTRSHCDMESFRRHAKFGPYANSDLFKNLLSRQLKQAGIGDYLRLDQPLPAGVAVDTSGFLAAVTVELG